MKRVTQKDFDNYIKELHQDIGGMPLSKLKKDKPLYRQEKEYWIDSLIRDGQAIEKNCVVYWKPNNKGV